jgi:phosphoglycolate phosphatase-like HAD superfamily hydrolase
MERRYWIFDLDGTITVPVHDFETMRRELGLPDQKPILEEIAKLPQPKASQLFEKLDAMEFELATLAVPQVGAVDVLREVLDRGGRVGIYTRNSSRCAWETLSRCGLGDLFGKTDVVTREVCEPKPSPEGIHLLLSRWKAGADEAVMVGDYLFDMLCGREAGVATVGFSGKGHFLWQEYADYIVSGFAAIFDLPVFPKGNNRT